MQRKFYSICSPLFFNSYLRVSFRYEIGDLFKHISLNELPVYPVHLTKKKAWMAREIMTEWLQQLNRKMRIYVFKVGYW